MKRIIFAALLFIGCKSGGSDVHLTGDTAAAFRKLIRHDAITLSDSVTIYGVEAPAGSQIVCHENAHKNQARVIADALVAIGALDDNDISRAAIWLAVYGADAAIYGYANRFEKEAAKLCP